MSLEMIWIPLLTFAIAVLLTRGLCGERPWLRIQDHPNERSLHTQPTPRSGGVAMVLGLVIGLLSGWIYGEVPGGLGWISLGGGLIAGVSLLDDFRHVPARWRFLVHMIAAALLVAVGLALRDVGLPLLSWSLPVLLGGTITVLLVIWMINLYNFMDGMDGFAAGMATIGFSALAVMAWRGGAGDLALSCLTVALAGAGFLVYNFPKARIFMGDLGSSLLGYLAIAFALWADRYGVFPLWAALLVFSPFIVDASVTLAIRLARRERVWEAHRTHAYQRLVQYGWGHRKTVLRAYVLMLACAVSAIVSVDLSAGYQAVVLIAWVMIYLFLWLSVRRICATD